MQNDGFLVFFCETKKAIDETVKWDNCENDQSCIGVVLLAGYSIRKEQSGRVIHWKLLNEKCCKDA
jgi:hypothetical protein